MKRTTLAIAIIGSILALAPVTSVFAQEEGEEEMEEEAVETIEGLVEVEEFEDEDGVYETVTIRTDDDQVYEVDDRTAIELSEKAGQRVRATGITSREDDVTMIFVDELEVLK